MTDTNAQHAHQGSAPGTIAFNLTAIALLAALIGLGFAYSIDMLRTAAPAGPQLNSPTQVIEKTIAGKRLAIPSEWFRFDDQKTPGFSEKIDLIFTVPLGATGAMQSIEVTLMPRSRVRPSNRLLDSVYLHLFEPEQLDGPIGLVGKPLKPVDGFQNETVWYDPVSQAPFVAKCAPVTDDPQKSLCMRTVLVADQIAASYVFDAELLNTWKSFDAETQRWLSRIGGI